MDTESKIEEFIAITGAKRKVAESLLNACNGSLELAVNMHMEGVDTGGGASGGASGPSSQENSNRTTPESGASTSADGGKASFSLKELLQSSELSSAFQTRSERRSHKSVRP